MKILSRCCILLASALCMVPASAGAITPSGTLISAMASANCTDSDGNPVDSMASDPVIVRVEYPTDVTPSDVRGMAEGRFVQLRSMVVVGGTPELGGVFYVETSDRSAGLRVQTDQTVCEGDFVTAAGIVSSANGEKQIDARGVLVASSGNALPGTLHLAPDRYSGSLDATGILMRVVGRVTAVPSGTGFFYLDDGTSPKDGSGYTGVRVYGSLPADAAGKCVSVIGIPGLESAAEGTIKVIRTRRAQDVAIIPGAG